MRIKWKVEKRRCDRGRPKPKERKEILDEEQAGGEGWKIVENNAVRPGEREGSEVHDPK